MVSTHKKKKNQPLAEAAVGQGNANTMTEATKKKTRPAAARSSKKKAEPQRIGIVDLMPGMCKWPIGIPGEADFTFCGQKTTQSPSYCTPHAQVAYHVVCTKKPKKRVFPATTVQFVPEMTAE